MDGKIPTDRCTSCAITYDLCSSVDRFIYNMSACKKFNGIAHVRHALCMETWHDARTCCWNNNVNITAVQLVSFVLQHRKQNVLVIYGDSSLMGSVHVNTCPIVHVHIHSVWFHVLHLEPPDKAPAVDAQTPWNLSFLIGNLRNIIVFKAFWKDLSIALHELRYVHGHKSVPVLCCALSMTARTNFCESVTYWLL